MLIGHTPQLIAEYIVYRSDGSIRLHKKVKHEKKPDTVTITTKKPDGSIDVQKIFPVKSFLSNWAKGYQNKFAGSISGQLRDTGNTLRMIPSVDNLNYPMNAAVNNSDWGIVVGTDDGSIVALDIDNYVLGGKIAHGTGDGTQLLYDVQHFVTTETVGTDCTFAPWRTFVNNQGAITIQEVGAIYKMNNWYFLCLRDLEDEAEQVIDVTLDWNQPVEVRYTFTISQASGYVENMLKLMESMASDSAIPTFTDTDGDAGRSLTSQAERGNCYRADAAADEDAYGVVVGTGDVALDITDSALGAQITDGSGAGELEYETVRFQDYWNEADDMYFAVERTFCNHSGGDITIEEAGIYTVGSGSGERAMVVRTLTGGLDVLDAANQHENILIRYIFKFSL